MWRKTNETKAPGQSGKDVSATPEKPAVTAAVPSTQTLNSSPSQAPVSVPAPVSQVVAAPPAPIASKPVVGSQATPSSSSSVIGTGLKIRGEISGNSDLRIEGEAQGEIRLSGGRVSVGNSGNVQANIDAREISIDGTLRGDLKASESVRLGPSSNVQGSILTPRIGIEDGARLRGKVEMVRAGESRPAPVAPAMVDADAKPAVLQTASAAVEGATAHA